MHLVVAHVKIQVSVMPTRYPSAHTTSYVKMISLEMAGIGGRSGRSGTDVTSAPFRSTTLLHGHTNR